MDKSQNGRHQRAFETLVAMTTMITITGTRTRERKRTGGKTMTGGTVLIKNDAAKDSIKKIELV